MEAICSVADQFGSNEKYLRYHCGLRIASSAAIARQRSRTTLMLGSRAMISFTDTGAIQPDLHGGTDYRGHPSMPTRSSAPRSGHW
jgi:hypothetical protein